MRTTRRVVATLLAACVVSTASLPGWPASAGDRETSTLRQAPVAVPVITWENCGFGDTSECATVQVPLDYDDPAGPAVSLDLLRVPAADPGNRIGTLFVNPGGPGRSAREYAYLFDSLAPDVVSQRFDVVGIDPRGAGPSAPMTCRTGGPPDARPLAPFPRTERQIEAQIAYDRYRREACRTDPSPIVGHMTTADTARDMDLVRQALGEAQVSYFGFSYGTQLGTTYAAMFPDNIRAMILDGVLDPVAWTTGADDTGRTHPYSERVGSAHSAWRGLVNAFAECDRVGKPRCAIAGAARGVWGDIIQRLRRGPFKHDGFTFTYSDLVTSTLVYLQDRDKIDLLMSELKTLHRQMFGRQSRPFARNAFDPRIAHRRTSAGLIPGLDGGAVPAAGGPGYGTVRDATLDGVACADSDNPPKERTWVDAARRADRSAPWFGAAWTWSSSACASWPGVTKRDRFTGPFAVTPSAPVLLVGTTYDPATPLRGARAVNGLLGGSRLLVLDGWGHGAIGSGPCINQAYASYLVDLALPPAGTVCKPARQIFPR